MQLFELRIASTPFKDRLNAYLRYANELEAKFANDVAGMDEVLSTITDDPCYAQSVIIGNQKHELERVFIQHLRSANVVTACSFLESRMHMIANLAKDITQVKISLEDIHGSGIRRANTYLEKAIGVDMSESSNEWGHIKNAIQIRNCIVHCGGNTDYYKSSQSIINIIKRNKHLSLYRGKFISIDKMYFEWLCKWMIQYFKKIVFSTHDKASSIHMRTLSDAQSQLEMDKPQN